MRKYWWVFVMGLCSTACYETSLVGDNFFGEADFQLSFVDTVQVSMSTVKFDSLITSSWDRLLVGAEHQEGIGEVTALSFFQFTPAYSYSLTEEDEYDSMTIVLYQDGYTEGVKEEAYVTLQVDRLSSELELRSNGSLYNTSFYEAHPLDGTHDGQRILRVKEAGSERLEISFASSFGSTLFDKLRDQDEILNTNGDFYEYFKGVCLSLGEEAATPFVGFRTDSTALRLYYTNRTDLPKKQKFIQMKIDNAPNYVRFVQENIPEELQALKVLEDEVPSSLTNDQILIAGGLGYAGRVTFPSIRNLLLDGTDYLISSAQLKLYPLTDEQEALPESLRVYYVNEYNTSIAENTYSAELVLDDEYGRDTYYTLDVTDLVKTLLQPLTDYHYGLLFTMPDDYMNVSMKTTFLGNTSLRSELILYTITNN